MADNPLGSWGGKASKGKLITKDMIERHVQWLNSLDFVRASGRPYFVGSKEVDGEVKHFWDRYASPADRPVELVSQRERAQVAMENIMHRLAHGRMTQEQVNQLSKHNKRVAEARGLLMIVDGHYRLRPSLNRRAKDAA